MEQLSNNNPEITNQKSDTEEHTIEYPAFDKEQAKRLIDEYKQNHAENIEQENESRVTIAEYDNPKEASDALKNIEGQIHWKDIVSELANSIESYSLDEKGDNEEPQWMKNFKNDKRYRVEAITNDHFNSTNTWGGIAESDEKRIIIYRDDHPEESEDDYEEVEYLDNDYATLIPHKMPEIININGFSRNNEIHSGTLAEETDFTIENEANNKDIQDRINEVLFKLFGQNVFSYEETGGSNFYDYSEFAEYPDSAMLSSVLSELKSISSNIGDVNVLEKKRDLLKQKISELDR